MFLKISEIYQENTYVGVRPATLLKETPTSVFPLKFAKFLRTHFFYRTLPVAAPAYDSLFKLTCLCVLTLTYLYLRSLFIILYEADKIDKMWGLHNIN